MKVGQRKGKKESLRRESDNLPIKHIFALSDEEVCERWVYDPYFQYFTGEEFVRAGSNGRYWTL
jgi:Transposase domain (DUF772)